MSTQTPFKSKEDAKLNKQKWRERNPDKVKGYRKQGAKRKRIRAKERREEIRQKRKQVFGNKCVLCGKPWDILHEINGRNHIDSKANSEKKLKYALEHQKDFVPLCTMEHRLVHILMKMFGMQWPEILILFKRKTEKTLKYLLYVITE